MSKKISNHISYKEAIRSSTAKRKGIDNIPTTSQLANMKMVANKCFEPLREYHGKPIFVSSFLRSKALNAAIRGSKTSQHLQGAYTLKKEGALDIDADVFDNGITNRQVFHWLKKNVDYDQIIFEYPDRNGNPGWVHIGYRKTGNRNQALIAYKNKKGKKKYSLYSPATLKDILSKIY